MLSEPNPQTIAETDPVTTEAYVLHVGSKAGDTLSRPFVREAFTFAGLGPEEVLVEPIYGCWEANMGHALEGSPVDICKQRREPKVVLGNAGVVRVTKTGSAVVTVREGDTCFVFPNAVWDSQGYPIKILAYDAPGTMGVLAKQSKMNQYCLVPIPKDAQYSLPQWAAFSLRYVTAWANWNVSEHCWRAQMPDRPASETQVWGWGGGVSLAELDLAARRGYQTAMVASSDTRLGLIESLGIRPIDRRRFPDLNFYPDRFEADAAYRKRYKQSERAFLTAVKEVTADDGVSIFIDNIGETVFRATLKALARQAVITTCGWKEGMQLSLTRANEAIDRHIHVHTHYARYQEGLDAARMAIELDWMAPPVADEAICGWDEIPQLAADYQAGRVDSLFPIYAVNP